MKKILIVLVISMMIAACVSSKNIETAQVLNPSSVWSKKAPKAMKWHDAMKYCNSLVEDGYSDWRLPAISELRTLIQNCQSTETGGECNVTNDCLSYDDCRSDACNGCSGSSDGRYSKLGDTAEWFWSSSELSDHADYAWIVNFYNGYIHHGSNVSNVSLNFRCISRP